MSSVLQQPDASVESLQGSKSRVFEPIAKRSSDRASLASWLLNTDFCPQLNRYVYWLKEPVGWFAIAAAASLLVGAFLSPMGWTLAAGLIAMIAAGLSLPWVAVRFAECTLEPVLSEINELENSQLVLTVRNRLPLPLWGLMVEGYLAAPIEQKNFLGDASIEDQRRPDIGLACVPPLCEAIFRLSIRPEHRGFYPIDVPQVACAFPFGIWTARRKVKHVTPVTVWPMRVDLNGLLDIGGASATDEGVGERVGSSGEFLGVRAFRRGDSLRSIHWVQTARMDSLVVCDRSGPQRQTVSLELVTRPIVENAAAARDHLAWRVRIVASLAELLCARHIPFQLVIDNCVSTLPTGQRGLKQAFDLLAAIPLDDQGLPRALADSPLARLSTRICVGPAGFIEANKQVSVTAKVGVSIHQPSAGLRQLTREHAMSLDLAEDFTTQLNHFLSEVNYACFAA